MKKTHMLLTGLMTAIACRHSDGPMTTALEKSLDNNNSFIFYHTQKLYSHLEENLNKIKNDVLVTEYYMIDYVFKHVDAATVDYYENFSALVGSSTTYLKKGQSLIVSAGIGAFSKRADPRIMIDGVERSLKTPNI